MAKVLTKTRIIWFPKISVRVESIQNWGKHVTHIPASIRERKRNLSVYRYLQYRDPETKKVRSIYLGSIRIKTFSHGRDSGLRTKNKIA